MFTTALKKILIGVVIAGFALAAQATEKGLFWKLESPGGVTSYLFGTIHSDDNRVAEISPGVIAAIKQVDSFVMEVAENRDPSVMMLKEGNLASLLTEAEFEQVRELADFHVMHLGAAMRMKPWLLAVVFDLPKPQTPFAQDNLLMTKAEENLKEVIGIETAKAHFGVMDDFSLDEQMVMLRAVLKRTQAQKEADFERLMAAYLEGDSDKITALDEQITGGMLPKALWAKMRDRLLDKRNVVMAERTIKVANEKPVFVAVGASHLAGDNGLIAVFKKAGFKLSAMPK
ncbi:MAG TPA: TraB/GumN family protein [Methylotenera sp.]|nr:TraB/GumN family protein [Methylotenera sp.]HPV43917.1 TraB/GumN family protein [Methylotenera sp.]